MLPDYLISIAVLQVQYVYTLSLLLQTSTVSPHHFSHWSHTRVLLD